MLQHNPHSHSIVCLGSGETLDGFETREIADREECSHCRCVLMSTDEKTKSPAAKPAEAESE